MPSLLLLPTEDSAKSEPEKLPTKVVTLMAITATSNSVTVNLKVLLELVSLVLKVSLIDSE